MTDKKTKSWKKFKEDYDAEQEELAEESDLDLEDLEDEKPKLSYQELHDELSLSQKQATENLDKAKRALAEYENLKRRSEIEVRKAHSFGQADLIKSLLPVLDSLEQAREIAAKDTDPSMKEGLDLTLKLFLDVLKKQSVELIDPQGQIFNPEEHEAMAMVEAPDAEPSSVVSVFQKGYKLHDRVIRPARVIVAK